jgi:hypothetical protein
MCEDSKRKLKVAKCFKGEAACKPMLSAQDLTVFSSATYAQNLVSGFTHSKEQSGLSRSPEVLAGGPPSVD